jgi:hypothetical protein
MPEVKEDGSLQRTRLLLEADRADLRTILLMRFGALPQEIEEKIMALRDIEQTNRLVLVAANAPDMEAFHAEIASETPAFRILSQAFEPRSPRDA